MRESARLFARHGTFAASARIGGMDAVEAIGGAAECPAGAPQIQQRPENNRSQAAVGDLLGLDWGHRASATARATLKNPPKQVLTGLTRCWGAKASGRSHLT